MFVSAHVPTGDGTPADPSLLACPVVTADEDGQVYDCGKAGARYVVLHEHFQMACCAEHADDVEASPEAWRLVDGRGQTLRIAKAGAGVPIPDWRPRR